MWSTGISSVSERGGGEPAPEGKEGVEREGSFDPSRPLPARTKFPNRWIARRIHEAPDRGRPSGTVGPNSSRRGAPSRRRKRLLRPWRTSAVGLHRNSLRPPPDTLRTARRSLDKLPPGGGRHRGALANRRTGIPDDGGRARSAPRLPWGPSRTPNAGRSAAADGDRDSTRPPRSGSTPIVRSPPGPPAGRSRRRPSCDRLRPAPVIIPLPEMEGFGPRGPRKGTQ